jgi:pimeloyl-ACP methyl ester carboxylesterase
MANELSALAVAAGGAIDRAVLTPTQTLHAAVARRAFAPLGVVAAPTRAVHDAISGTLYSALRTTTLGGAARAARAIRRAGGDADIRPLSRSRVGRATLGAANAFAGDSLETQRSDLAIPMAVRIGGEDVACRSDALVDAFPGATPRPVVFVHGLAESDEWWARRSRRAGREAAASFGDRLRHDLGMTPVYVRYNTGLHVSENGRRFAALLEDLAREWPVEVRDLAIVGHSMGGLVSRSACHHAAELGHAWPSRVRHIVTLGTPHTGAPMAKAAHMVSWALNALPESRPVAAVMAMSAGISDLTFGYLRDEDWRDADRSRPFRHNRGEVPLLPTCTHTFIAATVTREPTRLLGRLAGDLLVRTESAGGRSRERSIPIDTGSLVHVGGMTHFDLLDHPLVYEHLERVLRGPAGERLDTERTPE